MKRIFAWTALLCLGAHAARPHDPFVLRASMREKPRMVLVALHADLSVAYDAQTCGLYQAWRGGVQDGNATYNHQVGGNHGATYYPQGRILYTQAPGGEVGETPLPDTRPKTISPPNQALVPVWTAALGGQAATVRAEYRGYAIDHAKETVRLRYRFTLANGAGFDVSELPEFTATAAGVGLQRDFAVTGAPAGLSLALQLSGNPIRKADGLALAEAWSATGIGTVEKRGDRFFLVLAGNGESRLTGGWQ